MADTQQVVKQFTRTELAGDPYASAFGALELAKSKRGTAFVAASGTLVTLISQGQLSGLAGGIMIASLAAVYQISQLVVDIFKERNRALAREVTTTTVQGARPQPAAVPSVVVEPAPVS